MYLVTFTLNSFLLVSAANSIPLQNLHEEIFHPRTLKGNSRCVDSYRNDWILPMKFHPALVNVALFLCWMDSHRRCVPNHVLMHYSMTFCRINSASSVYTEHLKKKVYFKYPDDALKWIKKPSTALIMSQRGRGYKTQIIIDKITLYISYTTWLSI